MSFPNHSADLIWEVCNKNNSYLCKRRSGGGVQFSRDPLNLTNTHARKYAGFVNDKAIGVQSGATGKTVVLVIKKSDAPSKPAKAYATTQFGSGSSNRKVYKAIVASTAKRDYRPDLRRQAVARASAVRKSQGPKKDASEKKLRGNKAKKAAEAAASSS